MRLENGNGVSELMEQLIAGGPDEIGAVFASMFNFAMRIERERFLNAQEYERSEERQGYANGTKPKRLDTPAGTVMVEIPKTRGHAEPFYPQSLERGRRSTRAVMLAAAEMYIQGVSTRDVEKVMAEFGIEGLSSSQVSRATQQLDGELMAWRQRSLGVIPYLLLDARYEKARVDGVVRDVAVLSAVGVEPGGTRRVLGVSVELSEAEVHWRSFLESLVARGLHAVEYIVSDDHSGLRAALRAVLPAATWQRCQFHLARNAINHAGTVTIRERIGGELRNVWNASTRERAQEELKRLVNNYSKKAPKLAQWLETNIPEGLAVFSLPESHRKKLRTSNLVERTVQQELKRRTRKIRVFPNEDSLLRLATAVLVELDEHWVTRETKYIKWSHKND